MSLAESEAAKSYWKVNHVQSTALYREGHEHRWAIAEHIASLVPDSVLEFGCSSGRNLAVLRRELPGAELAGMDMSELAIQNAREAWPGVEFFLADESGLGKFYDGQFDVVFTCSVLDHIPEPEWRAVYRELLRVAGAHLILVEPWRDDEEFDLAVKGIPSVPYTYCHAYRKNDPKLRLVKPMPMRPALEQWGEFGDLYQMFQRDK